MAEFIDTHCHLDLHEQVRPADQIANAHQAGVTALITVGTNLASSTEAVQTAYSHDGVWAAVGVHPNDAMEATDAVMDCVSRLARQPEVVAVGETGLDYYREGAPRDRQHAAFRAHIALAKHIGKALVVHCRDAWDDLIGVLEEEGAPARVVLHCFSGGPSLVEKCAAAGYFISYAGNVTFHNAPQLRQAAAATPVDQLLTETDSPFLTPHPHRGQPNEPARIALTVRCLAEVTGLPADELAARTAANARRAFCLPDPVDDRS